MKINLFILSAVFSLLSGCGSLSGIGGQSSSSCKAPSGVSCNSVSGNYANMRQHNLPAQRAENVEYGNREVVLQPPAVINFVSSGDPIRSKSKTLRVWIAPWEDAEGDLRDQSYAYVVVENGRWLIDHNRKNIVKQFAAKVPTGINATNNQDIPRAKEDKDVPNAQ